MWREVTVEAARLGGAVLLQKFGTALRVEHKGAVDLVTEADKAAEAAIVDLLRQRCPGHVV